MHHHAASTGALCAAALFIAALSAPAEAAAPPGPYLGVGAGVYTVDINGLDTGGGSGSFDDSAAMVRGFGGLRLGPYWAVEADYQRLAQSNDNIQGVNLDVDLHAWSVSVRPILPLGEFVDLYGRAGWAWYDAKAKASASGFRASLNGKGDDFTWGGGVDFHLGSNLSLRADYSRIEIEHVDLDVVSAGVVLRF